jgi:hypothetical protein
MSNKNVIVTKVNIQGNNIFSNLYGNPSNLLNTYDEEGSGICTYNDQLIICGRTKHQTMINIGWDDVLLFSINNATGVLNWEKRYDLPLNTSTGEFAQKVLLVNNELFINGYYKSTVFNPNGSNDAFLLQTKNNGSPGILKVFGDTGDDQIFKLMYNNKKDGIVNAGHSTSFGDFPGSVAYAPYVIEAYQTIQEHCHDKYFKMAYTSIEFPYSSINCDMVKTKFAPLYLHDIEIPVKELVVCEKIPYPAEGKVLSVNKDILSEISIYPTFTNNILNITGVKGNVIYKIYGPTGNIVQTGTINNSNSQINVSNLASGMYIINIINDNNKFTSKFVKE